MSGSITLSASDRKALVDLYRRTSAPQLRLHPPILLLLHEGHSWDLITAVLFTSVRTINCWRQRYLAGGLEAVVGPRRPRAAAWSAWWVSLVIPWATLRAPTDFGFVRSRWTCATVTLLLRQDHGVQVSRATVRRCLRHAGLVWRRPRLVLRPVDPRRAEKLRNLRALLRHLRRYQVIHVICANARFHHAERCRKVREYLERWKHRLRLHFVPTDAPETNPIERVWWHLHEAITLPAAILRASIVRRTRRSFTSSPKLSAAIDW